MAVQLTLALNEISFKRGDPEILAKVSEVGMQGISAEERRFLEETSAQLREQRDQAS